MTHARARGQHVSCGGGVPSDQSSMQRHVFRETTPTGYKMVISTFVRIVIPSISTRHPRPHEHVKVAPLPGTGTCTEQSLRRE